MHTYTVVVTPRSFGISDPAPLTLLEQAGCTVIRPKDEKERARFLVEAHGVIAGLEFYSRELIQGCKKLKVISRYGVGYDNVDLEAAREKGIIVTITPGANSDAVADLAIALLLSAARHIPRMDAAIRAGTPLRPLGSELWHKTLGILGTGRIGKGVIKRASGFEMGILCYDILRDEDFVGSRGGRYVDLDTLLRESDFISLHLPLTTETQGIIGTEELKKMKSRGIIVNTARGGLIDEEALYWALKEGIISAAALDVTVSDEPSTSALRDLPNCILTPHVGATTYEATRTMGIMAVQNLLDALDTGSSPNQVF
jgi:D-3-phosphoglycerate dehydrogenase